MKRAQRDPESSRDIVNRQLEERPLILYVSSAYGEMHNTRYPKEIRASCVEELLEAWKHDHMFSKFIPKGHAREYPGSTRAGSSSEKSFVSCHTAYMDCDGGISVGEAKERFKAQGIQTYICLSRSNMKDKNGQGPEPRFHIYIPLKTPITDEARLRKLLTKLQSAIIPEADSSGIDPARFFFGHEGVKGLAASPGSPLSWEEFLTSSESARGRPTQSTADSEFNAARIAHKSFPGLMRGAKDFRHKIPSGERHEYFLGLATYSRKKKMGSDASGALLERQLGYCREAYSDVDEKEEKDYRRAFADRLAHLAHTEESRQKASHKVGGVRWVTNYVTAEDDEGNTIWRHPEDYDDHWKAAYDVSCAFDLGKVGEYVPVFIRRRDPKLGWRRISDKKIASLEKALDKEHSIRLDFRKLRKGPDLWTKDMLLEGLKADGNRKTEATCVPLFGEDDERMFIPAGDIPWPEPKHNGAFRDVLSLFNFRDVVQMYRGAFTLLSLLLPPHYKGVPYIKEKLFYSFQASGASAGKSTVIQIMAQILTGYDPIRLKGTERAETADGNKFSGISAISNPCILYDELNLRMKNGESVNLAEQITAATRNVHVMNQFWGETPNTFREFCTFNGEGSSRGIDANLAARMFTVYMGEKMSWDNRERFNLKISRILGSRKEIDAIRADALAIVKDGLDEVGELPEYTSHPEKAAALCRWGARVCKRIFPEISAFHFGLQKGDESGEGEIERGLEMLYTIRDRFDTAYGSTEKPGIFTRHADGSEKYEFTSGKLFDCLRGNNKGWQTFNSSQSVTTFLFKKGELTRQLEERARVRLSCDSYFTTKTNRGQPKYSIMFFPEAPEASGGTQRPVGSSTKPPDLPIPDASKPKTQEPQEPQEEYETDDFGNPCPFGPHGAGEAAYPDLSGSKVIAVDIETYDPDLMTLGPGVYRSTPRDFGENREFTLADGGRDSKGYILGVSLANEEGFAEYYNLGHDDCTPSLREKNLEYLKKELARDIPKIGANLQYDLDWLENWLGLSIGGRLNDVQTAEALIDENQKSYRLEVLARKYLGCGKEIERPQRWCDERGLSGDFRQHLWRMSYDVVREYAIGDAAEPIEIYNRQRSILLEQNLMDVYRLECALLRVNLYMRKEGVRLDVQRRDESASEAQAIIQEIRTRLQDAHGEFNYNSGPQIAKLFDGLGIAYPRTAQGRPSFDSKFLRSIADTHTIAKDILAIRKADKMLGTFLRGSFVKSLTDDGKIHCSFHNTRDDNHGTRSGRLSASNPNLQQIPSRETDWKMRCRSPFAPLEGCLWAKLDYSQIEYRFMAHYAIGEGSQEVRRSYNEHPDTDYHALIMEMTGLERSLAKNLNFGVAYGMGAAGMAEFFGWPLEKAREIRKTYFSKAPFMKETMDDVRETARRDGFIQTISGRRSRLIDDKDYKMFCRKIQGSAADLMKKAMVDIYNSDVLDTLHLHLTVHDELDFSVPKTEDGILALRKAKRLMEGAMELKVPIKADVEIGPNWADVSEEDINTFSFKERADDSPCGELELF